MAIPPPTSSYKILHRLFHNYLKQYSLLLLCATGLMVVSAVMTGAVATLMEPVTDHLVRADGLESVIQVASVVMLVFVIKGFSDYGHQVILNKVNQKVIITLQTQLYTHLLNNELKFFHDTLSGHILNRMINDIMAMQNSLSRCLIDMGKSGLTVLVLLGFMFYQDWWITLLVLVIFPLGGWITIRIGKESRHLSSLSQRALDRLISTLNQAFHNILYIQAYGTQTYEKQKTAILIKDAGRIRHQTLKVQTLVIPINETIAGFAVFCVIIYGSMSVVSGVHTVGSLVSYITAFLLAYEPMKRLSQLSVNLQTGFASAERFFSWLDRNPTITNACDARPLQADRYTICFTDVAFGYNEKLTLEDINLRVEDGQMVAFVGPSGAGKSTLFYLLPRFYDVMRGTITIGGVDIREVTLESLREHIAFVGQNTPLFAETVWYNIFYGQRQASEEDVGYASKLANIDSFLPDLSEGYNTVVGEHGLKLSGGQRQRVAIARAMIRDAPILLLDEATSALDSESEKAIQNTLRSIRKGRTTIVIAHRLSSIIDADHIYVFNEGRVVENGTHQQLLQQSGLYARLYGLQQHTLVH